MLIKNNSLDITSRELVINKHVKISNFYPKMSFY